MRVRAEGLAPILKTLRSIRFVRAVKMSGQARTVLIHVQSNSLLLWLGRFKALCAILLSSHMVCCGWYAVDVSYTRSRTTCLRTYATAERPFGHRYLASLHWSLTQFTPASMEMSPAKTPERAYANPRFGATRLGDTGSKLIKTTDRTNLLEVVRFGTTLFRNSLFCST